MGLEEIECLTVKEAKTRLQTDKEKDTLVDRQIELYVETELFSDQREDDRDGTALPLPLPPLPSLAATTPAAAARPVREQPAQQPAHSVSWLDVGKELYDAAVEMGQDIMDTPLFVQDLFDPEEPCVYDTKTTGVRFAMYEHGTDKRPIGPLPVSEIRTYALEEEAEELGQMGDRYSHLRYDKRCKDNKWERWGLARHASQLWRMWRQNGPSQTLKGRPVGPQQGTTAAKTPQAPLRSILKTRFDQSQLQDWMVCDPGGLPDVPEGGVGGEMMRGWVGMNINWKGSCDPEHGMAVMELV
ncbi:unnamed protein product [Vitrella brassicaformis CCMP3155]|uniref:Uncharacterized protein n=1 Tax=Vitrella brassicaformis (strain CCMP3155) TaxID=1169540 RepID=A0A0G4H0D7_VITBC|nr:unnamed protein product [Vitrella brassicaformis CCMP3155]|eukprot:CEM37009.1 unnamed protein product [Vitrella brassicaformis CCMP3155]